jgi:serine/threonine protein kinase
MDDDGNPRLCDFGRSKFINDRDYNMPLMGSARYMAPELTEANDDFNFDSDFNPEVPNPPPNCIKSIDIFAFSMVALEVSDLPYFYFGMFFGILYKWWFGFTSLLCQPVVW